MFSSFAPAALECGKRMAGAAGVGKCDIRRGFGRFFQGQHRQTGWFDGCLMDIQEPFPI